MKINVKHTLKIDVDSAFKVCTEQKNQESIYAQLGGQDVDIKREGRTPKVKLTIFRKEPMNPPAAIRRIVPSLSEVTHTEQWAENGDGYAADIVFSVKGVPVKALGTKQLRPTKSGCTIEWKFDVTSGIPLVGGLVASFAGGELEAKLEKEAKVLKSMT